MTNISPKNRLDAIDVLRLPDGDAVRWLKEKSCYEESIFSSDPEQELHRVASFAFSRRGSKRLRLAVARYGSHIRTLRNLFNKGTRSERLAVLSNPYIGPQNEGGLFSSDLVLSKSAAEVILQNYQSNTREFAVFANNPQINREWLAARISSWLETKGFDSNGLLFLVHYLVDNPIINARAEGRTLSGAATIDPKKDVMPSDNAGIAIVEVFHDSIISHVSQVENLGRLRGTARSQHPVFGSFDAHKWHCMFAFHLGLHLPQAKYILEKLKAEH